ncbi:hypothetical protein IKE98_03780 [Candidatus Saccharibacteria bacterium]|nr:hypothetical protein [Candidatus Saccharibacteria bacterium]
MRGLNEWEMRELRMNYIISGHKLLTETNRVKTDCAINIRIRHPAANIQKTISSVSFYVNIGRFCRFSLKTDEDDPFWVEIVTDSEQVASDLAKRFDGSVKKVAGDILYHIEELPDDTSLYEMILYLNQLDDILVIYDVLIIESSSIKYGKLQ